MKEFSDKNSKAKLNVTSIIESLPDPYLILSTDFRVITASEVFLQRIKRTGSEVIGKSVHEIYKLTDFGSHATASLQHSLEKVKDTNMPDCFCIIKDNGSNHIGEGTKSVNAYWDIMNIPVNDNEGNLLYICLKVQDITERVKQKLKIKETKRKELLALAKAQHQRDSMEKFLMQLPAGICILQGADLEYEFVNPTYQQQLFPGKDIVGKPLFEAVPEVKDTEIANILHHVYQTGETVEGKEMYIPLAPFEGSPLRDHYFNFIQQARRNENGDIDGIMTFAYEITELVVARKTVEQSESQLTRLNEQLALTNEELIASNKALLTAKIELETINNELENRVALRTAELENARAEADMQRKRMIHFFHQAPAAICILDGPELTFELVNPSYQKLFPGKPLLGKPVFIAIPEIIGTPIADILKNVFDTGETFYGKEIQLQLSPYDDGILKTFYFNFIYQARLNTAGAIDGIMVFANDVTDLVLSKKITESSFKRFEKLSNSLPQMVWTATPDGNLNYFNEQWHQFSGLDFNESVGIAWTTMIHPGDLPNLIEKWNQSLATGAPYEIEARVKSADDQYFWFLIRAICLLGEDDLISQWFGTCTNIEEQKDSERKFKKLNNDLEAANQKITIRNREIQFSNEELLSLNNELIRINSDLDNFIYTASHDLKTPISNIEGLVKALDKHLSNDNRANPMVNKLINMIDLSIVRFKNTLLDLAEIVKVQRIADEDKGEVNLLSLIEDIRSDLHQQILDAGASIRIDLNECHNIHFSKKNIRSILYNLISNAIKYRAPSRVLELDISCNTTPAYHIFKIQDNGLGMDSKKHNAIFGMFKRLHSHVEGSGVGLYIVKKIVDSSGGKIEVNSQVGKGSTFTVYLKR